MRQRPLALSIGIAALLLWVAGCGNAFAEANVNPGINSHYQDARYEHWVRIFERPGREVFDRRFEIVRASAVIHPPPSALYRLITELMWLP